MAGTVQLPWPVSVGIWCVENPGGDRFTERYKPGLPVLERIKLVGKMRGISGIEIHYPYEVDEDSFEAVRAACRNEGLKIVTIAPGLFREMEFKDGAMVSLDRKVRRKAIERFKTAMRMCLELKRAGEGGEFTIYWPAADGYTYTLTSYHPQRRKMMRDALIECLEDVKGGAIAVEHKPNDPAAKTYYGTTAENILLVRDVRAAIGDKAGKRIGINPEMAHLLMANASLGEDISLILEEKMLFHTHWNTIKRLGADTDMLVGADNWLESMEVFFWLDEYKYDRWLGLDILPRSEDSVAAVDVCVEAMERMYAEMMSIKDEVKEAMRDPSKDATYTLRLLMRARGAAYKKLR